MTRRGLVSWGMIVGCGLMGAVGCQNPYLSAFEAAAKEYPSERIKAEGYGMPFSIAELAPKPVPDDQNIETLLREVRAALRQPANQRIVRELRNKETAEASPAARLLKFAPIDAILNQAVLATNRPAMVRQRDWNSEEPWNILFPEFAEEKAIVNLLAARGQARAEAGDTTGALRDFRAGLRIAQVSADEPFLIASLVSIAETAILLRHIELSLPAQAKNNGYLRQVRSLLAETREMPDFRATLRGEAAFGYAAAEYAGRKFDSDFVSSFGVLSPDSGSDGTAPPEDPTGTALMRIVNEVPAKVREDAFKARHLQYWNSFFEFAKTESNPRKLSDFLDTRNSQISPEKDPTQVLMQILGPVFSQAGDALVRQQAGIRALDALLASLEYRNRTGQWPETLAAAGYTKPDPFTGQPLRIRKDNGEVRVYSLGQNETDEGGYQRLRMGAAGSAPHPREMGDTGVVFPRTSTTVDAGPAPTP